MVEISSSVIPSAKYSSPGFGLMFANGMTAIRLAFNSGDDALSFSHGITTL